MTTEGIAAALLRHARTVLAEAERMAAAGDHALAVRRSQEAVELTAKALLRSAGVEVPHVHDVGPALRRNRARFGPAVKPEIDRLARISRRLARERTTAFYGEEESGASPEELYDVEDAHQAAADARWAVELCARSIESTPSGS